MIKEDYISFETAKLLKEKGFDINVANSWHIVPSETCNFEDLEKFVCGDVNEPEYSKDYYPMITLQMAMKWLRKEKKIICLPHIEPIEEKWFFYVVKLPQASDFPEYMSSVIYDTYEKACEAAIKYCLENLI